jgi:L-ascorbate metabolism protein UlaG (beta-lactamase superfamily)
MIEPVLKDDAFLADVAAPQEGHQQFRLWWLGQSGFLIQWQGQHLLLDPYLSESLTHKYAHTDKPHVRMTARVVNPERLDFIDVVTSSHNHTDHLDAETLKPLLRVNPELRLVVPRANLGFVAERLGIDPARPVAIDEDCQVEAGGFRITGVASAHETVERDEKGCCRFLGYIIEFGPWAVYHSGDTVLHPGLSETLRKQSIDLALLPINGRAPERRVAGNLSGPEAARLAKEIRARLVIPCHYEMFEFNTASPDEFARTAAALEQPFHILRCGERWSSASLGPRSRV